MMYAPNPCRDRHRTSLLGNSISVNAPSCSKTSTIDNSNEMMIQAAGQCCRVNTIRSWTATNIHLSCANRETVRRGIAHARRPRYRRSCRCRPPAARRSGASISPSRCRGRPWRRSGTPGTSIWCWCSAARPVSQDQQLTFASYFGDLGSRKKAPEQLRARAEGTPAGPREGSAGQQHQGRQRRADRRLRRGRVLVPHRFRLFGEALPLHVPLCARAAVDRRQHHVLEHVQGL